MDNSKQFAKEIHRPKINSFERRKVVVAKRDEIWAMDLASMESYVGDNDGFKYFLCVIDVFSKFAWCVPLKNKTGPTILKEVKEIVDKSKRKPHKIWVDQGGEFYNKDFKKWTKDNGIEIYSTYGDSKSVVVERFIRTIKDKIAQEFTAENTRNWVHLLPAITKSYNSSKHRTIKMSPKEASKPENELQVYTNLNSESPTKKQKAKYKVNDEVRISRIKETFEKGSAPNWSREVFKVSEVLPTNPITYKLIDLMDDPIDGSFYEPELQKTLVPDYYDVEKILKTRKKGKTKEYFVRFAGWPPKFDLWLTEDQLGKQSV